MADRILASVVTGVVDMGMRQTIRVLARVVAITTVLSGAWVTPSMSGLGLRCHGYGDLHIVSVGIDNYPNLGLRFGLRFAKADARAIAQVLLQARPNH